MEFRILGPLEVVEDGRTVDVGAAKLRALLAVLLLNANRVVSRDELIEALWGERAPGTAQKALGVYVSQLRKALGRDRIVTRPSGYEIRVAPAELDTERFEQLAATGDLEGALRIWRGPPLADFTYEPFAQGEIARLEERRLALLEERIERDLHAGGHAALVGELEALVREHPLRERLRAQLMLALYRSGRQAEALDVYQSGRRLLADELGLEPGTELRELQRAILEQDTALNLPREPSAAEPASPAPAPPPKPMPATREARKTVTVLSCEVTASGAQLDPESLRWITARGFEELVPVLEHHGATVERSLAGAITALFGIPNVHEDDALRAVRAALELGERLAGLRDELELQWGAWLGLQVGVSTGEVVTGGTEGQPSATGAPVQTALSLARAAAAGELLLDARTYRLVRDAVEVEVTGEHVRLLDLRAPAPSDERRLDSPMVGRERERRRLHDVFEQAVGDRSCQLFTLLGVAGVGKSRLVQEFADDLAGEALIARGRCLPYGEGITFWPVLEAVRDAAGLDESDTPETSLERIARLLEGEEEAELAARRLGEVLGLTEDVSGAEETFWAVRALFEALSRRRPLVVVFDDIHWGEPTFLDLVDHVGDWARDAPVLLLCIARPELLDVRPQWGGGKLNATTALLEPLSETESVELVDNLSGAGQLGDDLRRRIVETAGGNPLFVEEMLALVLEDGRGEGSLEVPPTIQALLAARLDRLGDDERSAIEAASVEGKIFHLASVADLVSRSPSDVLTDLQVLVRKELIRPDRPVFSGDRAYRFRHLLIRDAAYESVPKATRAALHERHAAWLEERAGERTLEFEEILGYHLEQAFHYRAELGPVDEATSALGRRAAERLGAAGRRAFARSDAPAAVNLISRAVALLPTGDPARVDLVPNVRGVQGLDRDLSWAEAVLGEAVAGGDEQLEAHALVQRGFLRLFTAPEANADELLDDARRAIAVFEHADDELGLARAWRLVAQARYLDRRAGACVEASEHALAHVRRAGDAFEEHEIVEWLVVALFLGPAPASQAAARCEELLLEVTEDPSLTVVLVSTLGHLEAMHGELDAARRRLADARRLMEREDGWVWLFSLNEAFVSLLAGDPAAAERELRPAYEALRGLGERSHFSSMATILARATYDQGRYEDATELARDADEAARPNDVHTQTVWRTTMAKALARRGELDAALSLALEGIAFAETSDFLNARGDAFSDYAEILELSGRSDEAAAAVEEAIGLYELKENVMAAAHARGLLERLGANA